MNLSICGNDNLTLKGIKFSCCLFFLRSYACFYDRVGTYHLTPCVSLAFTSFESSLTSIYICERDSNRLSSFDSLQVTSDGNISTSTLNFTPTRQDHDKTLVCRATNELVKKGIKETSMRLNVFCKYYCAYFV